MILYFDNYITQEPLFAAVPVWSERVRKGKAAIYCMPSKYDITLYTLASYSVLDFSAVVVKYTLEDKSKEAHFEAEVKRLFPKAILINGRSDSQEKFKESLKLLRSLGDEWVFYAGNNDHPFVASSKETLERCMARAVELRKGRKFVSVYLSQMLEGLGAIDAHSLRHQQGWIKLGEDEWCAWAEAGRGFYDAIQLVHIDLFEHWFASKDLSGMKIRIFRSDSVGGFVDVPRHLVVVPKTEICAHFDGYSHLVMHGYGNPDELYPPLLIPPGFFEGKMKVAYGYDEYREGWLNINPSAPHYSFSRQGGTDLKIALEGLPLFWRSRIKELDINPKADRKALLAAYESELARRKSAWKATAQSRARQEAAKLSWKARYGVPRWIERVKSWSRNPDSLSRVLDERDSGAEGKVKLAAKKAIYSILSMARKKK